MTRSKSFWTAALLMAALGGCAAAPEVREYRWVDERTALADLRKRAAAIKTLSAECSIMLERPDGQNAKLDGALVMQPPNRLRLRAWKFSRAVFDLTLNDDGLWVMTMDDSKRSSQVMPASLQAADFVRELSLFTGGFFMQEPPPGTQHRGSDVLVLTRETNDGMLTCEVDRKMLTPRRYSARGAEGQRFQLNMDEYRVYDEGRVAWPTVIEARSDMGRILIEQRNVEINGELTPNAFVPPRRAEKRL